MSDIQSAAGTTIKIGTTAADPSGDTFQLIGEVTDLGDFGRVYEKITHKALDSRKARKLKGSYDDGSVTIQLGLVPGDAGQVAADSALNDDDAYNFQIEFDDMPSAGSNGTTFDFKGMVMSFTKGVGNADSIISGTITIEIDGDITETAAA